MGSRPKKWDLGPGAVCRLRRGDRDGTLQLYSSIGPMKTKAMKKNK